MINKGHSKNRLDEQGRRAQGRFLGTALLSARASGHEDSAAGTGARGPE
jgi:hypothetical protein